MWPFRKDNKTETSKTHKGSEVFKSGNEFVSIRSMDFYGQYSESPDGVFLIAWSDFNQSLGVGGFREFGEGTYILSENCKVLRSDRLQRPNDGKVANNGTIIINDWMFGEGLKGTFYALDKSGRQLIKYRFSANLFNNGISEDGHYAVCQCAKSDTEDDSVLSFFDLEKESFLWKIIPESGRADSFYFDCVKNELHLRYNERETYLYDFAGNFIDKGKWEVERINYVSAFELSIIAKEHYKEKASSLSEADAQEILSLLDRALKKGLDEYPNEKATVYRTMGEVKESLGKTIEAIHNYELALELNPKVGIKHRLNLLKKLKS